MSEDAAGPNGIVPLFSSDLEKISGEVAHMGGMVENALRKAMDALLAGDQTTGPALIAHDNEIDTLHARIDRHILSFLAQHQPLARDLRHAVAALKIAADLERIGDLGKNIVRRNMAMGSPVPPERLKGVARMGRLAAAQLKRVLDAYMQGDTEAAERVWSRDEEVDELYNSLFRELLTYMMEDPRTIGTCTHLLFIAKNLERIGDHCTNIAETILFLVTGHPPVAQRPKRHDYEFSPNE